MNKGNVNIPVTHYNELKLTIEEWEESHAKLQDRITWFKKSRKSLIEEFAEAECMGDLAKIARNYGYVEQDNEK